MYHKLPQVANVYSRRLATMHPAGLLNMKETAAAYVFLSSFHF